MESPLNVDSVTTIRIDSCTFPIYKSGKKIMAPKELEAFLFTKHGNFVNYKFEVLHEQITNWL